MKLTKNKILQYLNRRRMTQAELAAKAKVSKQVISYIANNKHTPSLSTAMKIANALNADLYDIFEFE